MITLKITRTERNPEYKPSKNMLDVMNQRYDVQEFSTFQVLDVEISEEQFSAIRKAVLEKF